MIFNRKPYIFKWSVSIAMLENKIHCTPENEHDISPEMGSFRKERIRLPTTMLSWTCCLLVNNADGKSEPKNILPNGDEKIVMNPMVPSAKITLNKSKIIHRINVCWVHVWYILGCGPLPVTPPGLLHV